MVIGWSMASHRTTDLVVDAVSVAVPHVHTTAAGTCPASPTTATGPKSGAGSPAHAPRDASYAALASMGSVADCFDNALAESDSATLECELFDQQPGGRFATRRDVELAARAVWAPIMPSPPVTRITGPPRSAGG